MDHNWATATRDHDSFRAGQLGINIKFQNSKRPRKKRECPFVRPRQEGRRRVNVDLLFAGKGWKKTALGNMSHLPEEIKTEILYQDLDISESEGNDDEMAAPLGPFPSLDVSNSQNMPFPLSGNSERFPVFG